ncbi:Hypothetical protein SRAE_2000027900 [Strongyloides ratti]|uniref:Protein ABHD13 n=1 Tax=Strongyloides ratti TaxID=34506 RepID=A0A090L798_STRRB|nr:Hypothetical protein SRAE_2000027900 [Strongyloides ratti]CEF65602.1 Hypothetical protein SRAE_2000027900 [Strongyloides ratti]
MDKITLRSNLNNNTKNPIQNNFSTKYTQEMSINLNKTTENKKKSKVKIFTSNGKKKVNKVGKVSSLKTKVEKNEKKKDFLTKKTQIILNCTKSLEKSSLPSSQTFEKESCNNVVTENKTNYIQIYGEIKSDTVILENELYIYCNNFDYEEINYDKYINNFDFTQKEKYDIFYNPLPIRPLKMRGRQLNFYKAVQSIKNQKYSIECTCKNIRNPIVKKIEKKSYGVYSNTKNAFKVFFRKSTGKSFVERCAFWPSKSEYFFYQTNKMIGMSYQQQIDSEAIYIKGYGLSYEELNSKMNPKNMVIDRKVYLGSEEYLDGGNFLFGYNHPCFFLTDPIEFFFIKSSEKNVIACAYTELKRQPKYIFIYSHPNAMDLSDSICGFPNISDLARFLEVNFITYDYSGYGISNGKPSEEVLKENLRAVIEYVVKKRKYNLERIVLFGYSIGGSLSAIIATEYPNLGGLILLGAPASLGTILRYQLLKSNIKVDDDICDNVFNTVKAISNVETPTLIIQSKADKMVPHSNGFAIYKNAKNPLPPYLLLDIKHNYMDTSAEALLKIKEFIQYNLKQDPL